MNASRQLPVPNTLLRWVDRVDLASYRADDHSCPLVHIPDAATTLVWRTITDGSNALLVVGPRTRAAYYDSKDIPACARFPLAPGAARALLGTPIDELTDHVVPLSELWGPPGVRLADQLTGLASRPMTAVKHMEAALSARAARPRTAQQRTWSAKRQSSCRRRTATHIDESARRHDTWASANGTYAMTSPQPLASRRNNSPGSSGSE
ncbi:hypothetical protein [Streptomyces oceani]|uniref:hypothetical protein n=1 Tax=Streptomyces oceani TaxID=1075402 RepID=UPI001112CD16|nr:hypothetical protein [Streptomyces oceani]